MERQRSSLLQDDGVDKDFAVVLLPPGEAGCRGGVGCGGEVQGLRPLRGGRGDALSEVGASSRSSK